MMRNISVGLVALLGITLTSLWAQDGFEIDEDALFGDTATLVDSKVFTDSGNVYDESQRRSTALSGTITSSAYGALERGYFSQATLSQTFFAATIVGDFSLDVRLPNSVKSYANGIIAYAATADSTALSLNELFLDFTLGYHAYFRAGKQILQWGRGYFFNPVDLVNVERKQIIDPIDGREGAFGLRTHLPFGTSANIYSFIDMGSISRPDSLALALKCEFLVHNVEFALSSWSRYNDDPVLGFDFSTSVPGRIMVTGELAVHRKMNVYAFSEESMFSVTRQSKEWVPQASMSLGRFFDFADINDRILITLEGYYNHGGSDAKTILPESVDRKLAQQLLQTISPEVIASALGPGSFSRWYLATFATVNRFILSDITLSINSLVNINQQSAVVSSALAYSTLNDLSLTALISGFVGPKYTEYTLFSPGASIELRAGIRF